MVIPSRWFSGGKGLDEFRESMLKDGRLRSIDDFLSASDVFPGVGLKGRCELLPLGPRPPRDLRGHDPLQGMGRLGRYEATTEAGADVFIRFNEGVSILKKVVATDTGTSDGLTLLRGNGSRNWLVLESRSVLRRRSVARRRAVQMMFWSTRMAAQATSQETPSSGSNLVDKWKVFVGYAAPGTGNRDTYPIESSVPRSSANPARFRLKPTCALDRSTLGARPRAPSHTCRADCRGC